jgi:hypothetical protein
MKANLVGVDVQGVCFLTSPYADMRDVEKGRAFGLALSLCLVMSSRKRNVNWNLQVELSQ